MRLTLQRRISAQILKCSGKRIRFDPEKLEQIKEAITKTDVRSLIKGGAIKKNPARGVSRSRARIRAEQKKKGRRRGHGTRKGPATARRPPKKKWVSKVRLQRSTLKELEDGKKINHKECKELYMKVKGGFFRSKRHLLLYVEEQGIKK